MKMEGAVISKRIARLIILYLHNTLTKTESKELDTWVCESDNNMELFSELTSGLDDNVFNPDDVIVDTENIIDLWVIAGLIVRQQKNLNNTVEEAYLKEWASSTPQRKKLYKKLQHPGYMQKMLVWNEMRRVEMDVY